MTETKTETKDEIIATKSHEFCLDDILNNFDEINDAKTDRVVTITHKKMNADFRFLVPELTELTDAVDPTTKKIDINGFYSVLSSNLLTVITDEMLELLKVGDQLSAIKKLFDKNQIIIVFSLVMDGVEEETIVIKKK